MKSLVRAEEFNLAFDRSKDETKWVPDYGPNEPSFSEFPRTNASNIIVERLKTMEMASASVDVSQRR